MSAVNIGEIKAILQENGCGFKTNSRSFILSCPRCRKKQKLYISQKNGRFVCFYCKEIDNFQGKPEYALVELTSVPFNEIRTRLYGADKEFESNDDFIVFNPFDFLDDEDETISSEAILPRVMYTPDILPLDGPYSEEGRNYLLGRGIDLKLALKYGMRYSPSSRRVIFPVQYQGELLGWQGRTISNLTEFYDDEFERFITINKALTSKGLRKDQTVMFRDNLKGARWCVLCEGPIDAIKADLCGGNVATMGKAVSRAQLDIIKNHGIKRIYLALDPDAAAEMRRILELFKTEDIELYDMRPPPGLDLGKMTLLEVKKLFDNAKRVDPTQMIIYIKDHYDHE